MEKPEAANVEEAEPRNGEPAEPQDHFSVLINDMFFKLMDYLEVPQQLTLRLVCHSLNAKIVFMFNEKRYLKLIVKKAPEEKKKKQKEAQRGVPQSLEPHPSLRGMQFEFVSEEPATKMQISIRERALNKNTALALGRFFPKIESLIIYWDTDDSDEKIDSFIEVMRPMCSELTAFGLIISGKMANPTALRKICSVINELKRPLKQLHLLVPECCEMTQGEGTTNVQHDNLELDHCIGSVTNLSMTGVCRNLLILLYRTSPQLDTLSIKLIQPDNIMRLLGPLRNKLASIKRLQLTNIESGHLRQLTGFLEWFPNVEQLHLNIHSQSNDSSVFSRSAWIRALKRLTKLTELSLYNFGLDFLTKKIALETVGDIESWRQIRKLTIASPDLFFQFRMAYCEPFLPGLKVHHIAHSIGAQFPGLRELNLWSGDSYLHQTVNQSWQETEQIINRALPSLLPAQLMLPPPLRQCQVNVQLRHPVMYNEYSSRPVADKRHFMGALGRHNLHLSRQTMPLIYHNRARTMEYAADLSPFVKGNFCVLDRKRAKALMQYYDELRVAYPGPQAPLRLAQVNFVDFEDHSEDEGEDVDMVDVYEVDEYAMEDSSDDEFNGYKFGNDIESIVRRVVDDMVEDVEMKAEYEKRREAERREDHYVDKHDYDDNFDRELRFFLEFGR